MDHAACAAQCGLVLLFVGLKNIDSERGGKRCQGRTGSRISRGNQADDEHNAKQHRHSLAEGYGAKEFIGLLGHGDAVGTHVQGEQSTQNQEQGDNNDLKEHAHDEILGRLVGILTSQAALHQVLIETRGGNDHEDAGDELLPEVGTLLRIIKEEHA